MEPPLESNDSNDVDHLSNLPDCIFHKILGLLDITNLSRIATLSRRCRNLCLSSPSLNMEFEEFRDLDKFGNFMVFFDHFLLLHNEMNIDRFSLCLRGCAMNYYDVGLHVGTWMKNMVGRNFKELNLNLHVDYFVLPSYILSCPSLRSLKLNLGYGRLKFQTMGFSWLEDLSLKHLQFNDKSYGSWYLLSDWISTSCKFLKRLYIGSVDGIKEINIASESLEELCVHGRFTNFQWEPFRIHVSAKELKYLSIKCDVVCFSGCSVEVYAPKLQHFYWTGEVPMMFCLGNFESLQQAYINIIMNQINDVGYGYVNFFIAQLVKIVSQVSFLTLTDLVIEVLSQVCYSSVSCVFSLVYAFLTKCT